MSKRSKTKRPSVAQSVGAKPAPSSGPPSARRRKFRIVAALVVPALFLLVLEGVLRLCGFGYPTTFFVRLDADTLAANPKFTRQFYGRADASAPTPVRVAVARPAGTRRVIVLGESAAAGTPDPAFSFSRMLDLMLAEQHPEQRIEVLNLAMRGINSHIIRDIAREARQLSPDLFIVYSGNNEIIGLHAPVRGESTFTKSPALIRAAHAVKRTKLAQLGESALRRVARENAPPQRDMEFHRKHHLAFDDPNRDVAVRNFRANLEDIRSSIEAAGARALFCSVAVNLRDFPPLGSLHRPDLTPAHLEQWDRHYRAGSSAVWRRDMAAALPDLEAALKLDDRHAELHFQLGRCHDALNHPEPARKHFTLARDLDALQFRTDSKLNTVTRAVVAAGDTNRIRFVDVEAAFASSALAPSGIPGEALFQEHVHFTFEGDHLLATTLLPHIRAMLVLPAPATAPLSRDECARRLVFTRIEQANVLAANARMQSRAPFLDQLDHPARQAALERRAADALQQLNTADVEHSIGLFRAALAQRPRDWMLHMNYGRTLNEAGQFAAAAEQFEKVAALFPHDRSARLMLAMSLLQAGKPGDALKHLEAAVRLDPEHEPARQLLQKARSEIR
jgi:tetratricopeptide (TPR) repeat protein